MTIEQLACFQAITEYDTFLEAAETLHISQSSLSKQLRKLEEELGVQLIDRSRRSASLTEAGELFAEDVRLILMQHRMALSRLAPYRQSHHLRIGTLPILGQYGLSEKLADFSALHPEFTVSVEDAEEKELTAGFAGGHYDAIIARELSSVFPAAKFTEIAEDELVAVLPASHPLAVHSSLDVSRLAEAPLLLMNPYTTVHQICRHLFELNGIAPKDIQTSRLETMNSRILAGSRIGLMPYRNFTLFRQSRLVALPLTPLVRLPVILILRPGSEKGAGAALMNYFEKH